MNAIAKFPSRGKLGGSKSSGRPAFPRERGRLVAGGSWEEQTEGRTVRIAAATAEKGHHGEAALHSLILR